MIKCNPLARNGEVTWSKVSWNLGNRLDAFPNEMDVSPDDGNELLHSLTALLQFNTNSFEEWRLLDSRSTSLLITENLRRRNSFKSPSRKERKHTKKQNLSLGFSSFERSSNLSMACSSIKNDGEQDNPITIFGGKYELKNPNHCTFNFNSCNKTPITVFSCPPVSNSSSQFQFSMEPTSYSCGTRGFIYSPETSGKSYSKLKFQPPVGTDFMMKNGISTNVSTRHHCISAMKEHENQSLEEIRLTDYWEKRGVPKINRTSIFGTGKVEIIENMEIALSGSLLHEFTTEKEEALSKFNNRSYEESRLKYYIESEKLGKSLSNSSFWGTVV